MQDSRKKSKSEIYCCIIVVSPNHSSNSYSSFRGRWISNSRASSSAQLAVFWAKRRCFLVRVCCGVLISRHQLQKKSKTNLFKVIELITAVLAISRLRVPPSLRFLLLTVLVFVPTTLRASSLCLAILLESSGLCEGLLILSGHSRPVSRTLRSSHRSDTTSALFQNLSLQPMDFLAQSRSRAWGSGSR